MRLRLVVTIVLVIAVAALFVAVPAARAQEGCSVATLKGSFGNLEQGTVLMDLGFGIPVPFQAAVAGIVNYDGAGNLSGSYMASFGGIIVSGTVTGTYTVSPDCRYTDFVPAAYAHRTGTITGEGMLQQIQTIFTDPWLVGYGTRKKTPVGGCSAATVKGTYSLFGQGMVPVPGPVSPVPGAHVGILTLDGKGTFHGEETVSLPGRVLGPSKFTGTYTVGRDCILSAEIFSDQTLHEFGVIVGEGIHQEYHSIITDALWVFVDSAKRQ